MNSKNQLFLSDRSLLAHPRTTQHIVYDYQKHRLEQLVCILNNCTQKAKKKTVPSNQFLGILCTPYLLSTGFLLTKVVIRNYREPSAPVAIIYLLGNFTIVPVLCTKTVNQRALGNE